MNKGLMCGICLAVGAVIGYLYAKKEQQNEEEFEETKKEALKKAEKYSDEVIEALNKIGYLASTDIDGERKMRRLIERLKASEYERTKQT